MAGEYQLLAGTRLIVRDGQLHEDEKGQLGVYVCEVCETLNASYGACPYCQNAADCVVVRTAEGTLLTMARSLARDFGVAPEQLGACRCCNERPSNPHWARICLPGGDVGQQRILSERGDGHSHTH